MYNCELFLNSFEKSNFLFFHYFVDSRVSKNFNDCMLGELLLRTIVFISINEVQPFKTNPINVVAFLSFSILIVFHHFRGINFFHNVFNLVTNRVIFLFICFGVYLQDLLKKRLYLIQVVYSLIIFEVFKLFFILSQIR